MQNHLNFLHGILAFAIRRAWATTNPVALVDRPRTPRSAHRRIRFLQPEELEAVLRAVPADMLGALERPAVPADAQAERLRRPSHGDERRLQWDSAVHVSALPHGAVEAPSRLVPQPSYRR